MSDAEREIPASGEDVERLRQAYRAGRPPDAADHIPDDAWEAYACGELPEEARTRVNAHIVACAACARTAHALLQLRQEAHAFDPHLPSAARVLPFWRRPAAAWTAGLLAAGIAAIALFGPPARTPEHVRGEASARVTAVSPVGPVSKRPDVFAWRRHPGATSYRVKLYAVDGRPLFTSVEVAGESVAIPPDVRLPTGCSWRVEALRDGRVIATSSLTRFQLAP